VTAPQLILKSLSTAYPRPLAIHELGIMGHSECALSARLRELRRDGFVEGLPRPGKAFKEWTLTASGLMEAGQ
jgi:DNA-binding HxlR family transcriptional regulator